MSAPHGLVGCASGRFCYGFGYAFFRAKIPGQIIQNGFAIGVGDYGAQTLHFLQFGGPLVAGQMLLSNTTGVMAMSASGLHLGSHGARRKRLSGRTGRLRAR